MNVIDPESKGAGNNNAVPDQLASAGMPNAPSRDVPAEAYPVFFLHIPKTAGTSFLLTLENLFGERQLRRFDLNEPGFAGEFADLLAHPLNGISCVAGHIPLHALDGHADRFRLFTILRNPIARIFSLYRFMHRASPEMKAELGLSEHYGFAEFITSDAPGIYGQTNNGMVRMLAGLPSFVDPDDPLYRQADAHPELVERALHLLETIDFGIAEDMPGTHRLIQQRWNIPFTLDEMLLNTTEHDDVQEDWRNIHAVVEHNRLDITFYERARAIYRRRMAALAEDPAAPPDLGMLHRPELGRETPITEIRGRQGFHTWEDRAGLAWIADGPPAARVHFIAPASSVRIRIGIFGIGADYPFDRIRLQLHGYPLPFRIQERDGAACVLETRFASTVPGMNTLGIVVPEFIRVREIDPTSPDPRRLGIAVTKIAFLGLT